MIKNLITPDRLSEQLIPIVKLAQHFLDVRCVEGAKVIEFCISSSLITQNSPFAAKLANMPLEDLCRLLVDVFKTSRNYLETNVFYSGIIRQFCGRLILRMKEKGNAMPKRTTILHAVKTFIQLNDTSLTHSLLEQLCLIEITKVSEKQFKQDLLKDFVSSADVWGKLDPVTKLMVLNTCSTIVEEDIASIDRTLDSVATNRVLDSNSTQELKFKLFNCSKLFIFAEKHRFDLTQKNVVPAFQRLFAKLQTPLFELVLEIYQSESPASPSIKNFPVCLEWYRDLCRRLFSLNFVSLIKSTDDTVKILRCLLWLSDDQSWQSFADKICRSSPSQRCDIVVSAFLTNSDVQQSIADSPLAFASFSRIVDFLAEQSKSVKEPAGFSWHQPTAKLSYNKHRGIEEVESFLHSARETMVFAKFINIHEARTFASDLQKMGPSNGFSVRATAAGSGRSARCEIVKNRNFYDDAVKAYNLRKSELAKLVGLRRTLEDRSKGKRRNSVTSIDDGRASSPAKRVKLDAPILELD